MCGILATIGFVPPPEALDVVAHRGPDGRGWEDFPSPFGPVTLGHRRLAIIDTSDDALQPMAFADDRFWIVFNGEIYNYLELRVGLEKEGLAFRTRSDTEVILAAYARWGEACLGRLWGMFAFAIFDRSEQRLFAARDRFGIKPLYYTNAPGGLAFASEIKQLMGFPGFERRMNRQRAWDFLAGGLFDHTDETLFEGVHQIRGGECVTLDASRWHPGQPLPIRRWYQLPASGGLELTEGQASERFLELMRDSVRLHLRADVIVGSCLSGGLDSSTIVCLADGLLKEAGAVAPMHTVSACYAYDRVDERPFIEAVAQATSIDASFVFPSENELVDALDRIAFHQDEPFGSTSIFAQWSVFACARREGVKVMLDGQGADEQLGGYHGMFATHFASLFRRFHWLQLWRALRERERWHGVAFRPEARALLASMVAGPRIWVHRRRAANAPQGDGGIPWLRGSGWAGIERSRPPFEAALARERLVPADRLGTLCRAHVLCTNLPMLLHYEDRSSMAHGVEARVPFLDHRLVEFSIGLGDRHKMVGADTKRVLRRAMRGVLPPKILERRDKLGFATPEQEWFRGRLRGKISEAIEDSLRRFPELFDAEALREHVGSMLAGVREVDFTLWRVVSLGAWARVFRVGL